TLGETIDNIIEKQTINGLSIKNKLSEIQERCVKYIKDTKIGLSDSFLFSFFVFYHANGQQTEEQSDGHYVSYINTSISYGKIFQTENILFDGKTRQKISGIFSQDGFLNQIKNIKKIPHLCTFSSSGGRYSESYLSEVVQTFYEKNKVVIDATFGFTNPELVNEYQKNANTESTDENEEIYINVQKKTDVKHLLVYSVLSLEETKKDGMSEEEYRNLQDATHNTINRAFQNHIDVFINEKTKKELEILYLSQIGFGIKTNLSKIPVVLECSAYFKKLPLYVKNVQRDGIAFSYLNKGTIVAFDVGVGKTMTAILYNKFLFDADIADNSLIVVPNQVYNKWIQEIEGTYKKLEKNKRGDVFYDDVDFSKWSENTNGDPVMKQYISAFGLLNDTEVIPLYNLGKNYMKNRNIILDENWLNKEKTDKEAVKTNVFDYV
ncbi:MAG: hypothetical protein QXS90_03015, partial [Candidatus Diapherotrites archaeon]